MFVVPGLLSLLHVVGVTVELGDVPELGAAVTLRVAPPRPGGRRDSVLRVGNAIGQGGAGRSAGPGVRPDGRA